MFASIEYQVVHAREPTSVWRENVIAVVILLRVIARMSWWREQVIKCKKFYHFAIGKGLNLLHYESESASNYSLGQTCVEIVDEILTTPI